MSTRLPHPSKPSGPAITDKVVATKGAAPLKGSPFDLLDQETCDFYLRSLQLLDELGKPYLVGGAYSLAYHAGIIRHTKDLDVFLQKDDAREALKMFQRNGYRTQLTFPHWLGKAFKVDDETTFVDVIYGSGNGLCPVDDDWFKYAVDGEVLGRPARLVPVEEVIWTKAFICERERYDGADINHLLYHRGDSVNWRRLMGRFAGHERVLLSHLVLYDYVYPDRREMVPLWVMEELMDRVRQGREYSSANGDSKLCRGTFLSREQYLLDLKDRGYQDARLQPRGPMSEKDVKHWTEAIGKIK